MNERIKLLAEQAGPLQEVLSEIHGGTPGRYVKNKALLDFQLEKFAELIVGECVSLCEDLKMQHNGYRMKETDFGMKNIYAEGEATCDLLQHKMKKHFGVEE